MVDLPLAPRGDREARPAGARGQHVKPAEAGSGRPIRVHRATATVLGRPVARRPCRRQHAHSPPRRLREGLSPGPSRSRARVGRSARSSAGTGPEPAMFPPLDRAETRSRTRRGTGDPSSERTTGGGSRRALGVGGRRSSSAPRTTSQMGFGLPCPGNRSPGGAFGIAKPLRPDPRVEWNRSGECTARRRPAAGVASAGTCGRQPAPRRKRRLSWRPWASPCSC